MVDWYQDGEEFETGGSFESVDIGRYLFQVDEGIKTHTNADTGSVSLQLPLIVLEPKGEDADEPEEITRDGKSVYSRI